VVVDVGITGACAVSRAVPKLTIAKSPIQNFQSPLTVSKLGMDGTWAASLAALSVALLAAR
jgi:hypothetical protein